MLARIERLERQNRRFRRMVVLMFACILGIIWLLGADKVSSNQRTVAVKTIVCEEIKIRNGDTMVTYLGKDGIDTSSIKIRDNDGAMRTMLDVDGVMTNCVTVVDGRNKGGTVRICTDSGVGPAIVMRDQEDKIRLSLFVWKPAGQVHQVARMQMGKSMAIDDTMKVTEGENGQILIMRGTKESP